MELPSVVINIRQLFGTSLGMCYGTGEANHNHMYWTRFPNSQRENKQCHGLC
jgi:hypothetical protein